MAEEGIDPVPVPVYKNKRIAAYAAVDANLAPLFLRYRWQLHQKGYAFRTTRRRGGRRFCFYLHREAYRLGNPDLAPAPSVDHLNGHGLDCRLSNLDGVTLEENSRRKFNGHRGSFDSPPTFCGRVAEDLPPF